MPFQPKTMQIDTVFPVDNLPAQMPRIPIEVIQRFPSMADYQKDLDRWYTDLTTLLQKQSNEMNDKINTRVKPVPATQG